MNYLFDEIGKAIDHYRNRCNNFIALSHLNIEESKKTFQDIKIGRNLPSEKHSD